MGYIFRYFFWPFVYAAILYVALKPIHELMVRFLKVRFISASAMILLLVLCLLIPLFLLLYNVAGQSFDFYQFMSKRFDAAAFGESVYGSAWVKALLGYLNVTEGELVKGIGEWLQKTSLMVFSNLTNLLTFSLRLSVNFFFMLLILFFLFIDGSRLTAAVYDALPFPKDIEKDVAGRLNEVIKVLIAGNLLIAILQGAVIGAAFAAAGLHAPLLWGMVAAFFSLIPVVGTAVVWIPAAVYLAVVGKYAAAALLGAWCFIMFLLLEDVVKPKLFGKRLSLHPLIFFFLLLGSLQAFNLPGVIIGPILMTLFYSFWEIYKLLEEYDARAATKKTGTRRTRAQ
jgi:predicted PurR-regulated permease PerM